MNKLRLRLKAGKRKRSLNQQIRSTSRKLAEWTRRLQARRELEQEIYETESSLARLKGFKHVQGVRTRETRPNPDHGHQQQPVLHSPGRLPPPGIPRRDKSPMANDLQLRLGIAARKLYRHAKRKEQHRNLRADTAPKEPAYPPPKPSTDDKVLRGPCLTSVMARELEFPS